jgi:hypothetical protein
MDTAEVELANALVVMVGVGGGDNDPSHRNKSASTSFISTTFRKGRFK